MSGRAPARKRPKKIARKAPESFPGVESGSAYVQQVLDDHVPASEWTILACRRHLRDLERVGTKDFPYRFDPAKAERVIRFFAHLPHIKGKWVRKEETIVLMPWQCFFIMSIFGWVHVETGMRRFRKVRLYVARKNAKSTLAAGIGLWMLTKDGEPGAEIYSGATTEAQAWEVFGPARQMCLKLPGWVADIGMNVLSSSIRMPDGSKFETITGNPGDGSSPHLSVTDEYHEHATDVQLSAMETGMGAREQPFSLVISTAGENIAGPCFNDWLKCQKVLQGSIDMDDLFCLIYCPDKKDDWKGELAMMKANPSLGVSVSAEFLRGQLSEAMQDARKQGHYKTKHLNKWVQSRDAAVDMDAWNNCANPNLKIEQFKGRRCYIAMDLASKNDLASLVYLFENGTVERIDKKTKRKKSFPKFAVFTRNFLPRKTVNKAENQHYRAWELEGWLRVTEGNIIDFGEIKEQIVEDCETFDVAWIAYDPAQATMLVNELNELSLPVVEYGATVLKFSEPMKEVIALIEDGRVEHQDDKLFNWTVSNVTAKIDRKDNIFPTKDLPQLKIDPFVGFVMCKGVYLRTALTDASFEAYLANPVKTK